MASGGRVIYKRAAPGRRGRHRSRASDDEDDEEYVLEEEEDEEESSDEALDASDASEEEFEFGGSTSGSDDVNRPAAELDEDDEISLGRRPKRLKCSSKVKKKAVKKPRVSYYDNDDDYKAEEEEEEEELEEEDDDEEIPSLRRRRKNINSRAVRSRYQKTKGSHYEEVEMEGEEVDGKKEILSLRRRGRNGNASSVRSRHRRSKGSEYEEEDIVEEEEAVEKEVLWLRKRGRTRHSPAARPHPQQTKGSDYEEEEMGEEDEKDEDFSPDEQDLVDEEASIPSGLKKQGQMKKGGKMQEQRISRQKKRGNRCWKRSEDDDDLIVKDRVAASRKTKKTKKARRKRSSTSKDIKKKSLEESDTTDFDFVSSDDDFVEETIMLDEPRNKSKSIQKTKSSVIRRQKVSPEESESSSDGDYNISEHVLRYPGSNGIVHLPETDRIVAQIKGVEKGKEKENEESWKPLCGICLTEEHRTTVRGVLNSCTHFFCFPCIMEWSKVESRCPVCKRRFGTITKSSRSDSGFGLRKAVIKVEKRDQVYQPSEEEIRRMLDPYENVVCIECHQGGDDSLMLLCDICDSPAHTYCVGRGREVPEGNWYCECCKSAGDDSSSLQNQNFGVDQAAGNSDMLGSLNETEISTPRGNTNLHRSSQPSFHEIDLNVSPRSVENGSSMSQPHGVGPSTVLGRRAIQQRICIMLSHGRSRHSFQET